MHHANGELSIVAKAPVGGGYTSELRQYALFQQLPVHLGMLKSDELSQDKYDMRSDGVCVAHLFNVLCCALFLLLFVLHLLGSMSYVSLYCLFLIVPSRFSNVYSFCYIYTKQPSSVLYKNFKIMFLFSLLMNRKLIITLYWDNFQEKSCIKKNILSSR